MNLVRRDWLVWSCPDPGVDNVTKATLLKSLNKAIQPLRYGFLHLICGGHPRPGLIGSVRVFRQPSTGSAENSA